jgi:PAS domain S-box-containing protein
MQTLPSDIDELLAVAEASRGEAGDAGSACRLLETCQPLLLLFADAGGRLVFADDLGSEMDVVVADQLALDLAKELAGTRACSLEVPVAGRCHWAFAVRLPDWGEGAIVGCLVRRASLSGIRPCDVEAPLVVCAACGWAIIQNRTQNRELRTRVTHLLAEHDMLKNSQARAVADAIEEREKRLQQQRQDMARLDSVMKLAADGIVTVNEEGIVESFNEAAGRIFGYDPQEVIGRNISMLASNRDDRHRHAFLSGCLEGGQARISAMPREVMGRRKDGTLFPLEIAVSEVPLDSRRVFTGIFRDIADRRRLERQLVQAQKMESVGQLAAGIAHEINTPTQYVGDNMRFLEDAFRDLGALLANCQRLCQAAGDGGIPAHLVAAVVAAARQSDLEYLIDEIPKAIGQSLEGVERVAKIVRSMKDFSHPGSETKQAVDLNRALESTLTVCRNEWKYVAEAVTQFDPDLPMVTCLPGECNQVFLNLIINAAHAISDKSAGKTTEKGTITVTTRRDGDWAEIRIADTGTGIPEEYRSRIFDPFFTTKEVGRGTGQGLAIAHSVITEKHGGTIEFTTEVGRGTQFIVRLPISGESLPSSEAQNEKADLVR